MPCPIPNSIILMARLVKASLSERHRFFNIIEFILKLIYRIIDNRVLLNGLS
jgi:hypothetical protein